MGSLPSVVSWEQDTTRTAAHLVLVYCLLCEWGSGRGCESQGEESIPLPPTLSVTFLTNPAVSDDLVCFSVSLFPTHSPTLQHASCSPPGPSTRARRRHRSLQSFISPQLSTDLEIKRDKNRVTQLVWSSFISGLTKWNSLQPLDCVLTCKCRSH